MNLDIKLHEHDLPDDLKLGNTIAVDCEMGGLNIKRDRKSTRLNSSHALISYAVFCLKKKT